MAIQQRVAIVDDSPVIRALFRRIIDAEEDMQCVATLLDGDAALEWLKEPTNRCDVIIVDMLMPGLCGIPFIKALRQSYRHLPVIVVSGEMMPGSPEALQARALGVVSYLAKPDGGHADPKALRDLLLPRIRAQAEAFSTEPATGPVTATIKKVQRRRPIGSKPELLAIGSSTGGPDALDALLAALPKPLPVPTVIVQHIPANFSSHLAERLKRKTGHDVQLAEDGHSPQPGVVYLAPGGNHLHVIKDQHRVVFRLDEGIPVHGCRPAVDPLFASLAKVYPGTVLAVILTGMGSDGTDGAAELFTNGCEVFAQDELSSVVWGMPGSAVRAGIVDEIANLPRLATAITDRLRKAGIHR